MVTNLASLGHCDSVKHLMLWHERSTTCPMSAGGVHDDVLRIASSTSAPGLGRVKTLGRGQWTLRASGVLSRSTRETGGLGQVGAGVV